MKTRKEKNEMRSIRAMCKTICLLLAISISFFLQSCNENTNQCPVGYVDFQVIINSMCEIYTIASENDLDVIASSHTTESREYFVKKDTKVYMTNPFGVEVHSITTKNKQTLYIGSEDIALLKDRRVLIVDDVVSTGESLLAVEKLVREAGGTIAGKMAVLAEGEARHRNDICFLEYLPLLDGQGRPHK